MEGVQGEWTTEDRERGEGSEEKWVGEVRLICEKFELEDPLGVGGERSVG